MLQPQIYPYVRSLLRWLCLGAGLLLTGHLLNWAIGGSLSTETINMFLAKFHLDSENSVAAWFNSMLLLLVGVGWLILGWLKYSESSEGQGKRKPMPWRLMLLAVVFIFLSCDEAASVHELLIAPVRNGLGVGGIFHLAWIIPAMGFLGVLAIVIWPLFFQVSPTLRWGAIIAGMMFVSGAIGVEMIGGKIISEGNFHSFGYILTITFEEGLEIGGLLFMLWTMVRDLNPATAAQVKNTSLPANVVTQTA